MIFSASAFGTVVFSATAATRSFLFIGPLDLSWEGGF
jgi:hypothetical protein